MARRCVVVALAVWLVLSSLPLSLGAVAAAPPDEDAVSHESPAAESLATDSGNEAEDPRPEADDRRLPAANDPTGSGSVRRRGLEAPVQLRQEAADVPRQDAKPADPGDGPPVSSRGGSGKRAREKPREDKPSRGLRVWPMRADSYTFSQAFGCVPQIAHFYQPGAGCPAEAPVIHHGIDMAAPEGTPFYAAASGWVTESGYDREVGVANTRIIIQHEGRNDRYATEYLHWIASFVEVGDYVEAGEFIGEVGSVGYSTGPHLHFSIIDLDTGGNLDPVSWLPDEAGNDAYRGRQPKEKASMRLPAGTTAGVPEFTDPAPPPPPERNDLREAGVDHQGRDRVDRQDKRDRKSKTKSRAAKRADRTGAPSNGDDQATADESAKKNRKGKNTERTRTRERNKDGQRTERSARGEDGSGEERRERSGRKSTDAANSPSDEEPSGKRSGKKSENRSRSEENQVKQRETDSGGNGREKNRNGRKAEERAREDANAAPAPAPERDRDKRKRRDK